MQGNNTHMTNREEEEMERGSLYTVSGTGDAVVVCFSKVDLDICATHNLKPERLLVGVDGSVTVDLTDLTFLGAAGIHFIESMLKGIPREKITLYASGHPARVITMLVKEHRLDLPLPESKPN